jgi:hypothetical protein
MTIALSEYVGGIIMIGLLAVVARFFFKPRLVEVARRRLGDEAAAVTAHERHGAIDEDGPTQPLRRRLRSAAGWADAASYTMADLTMLRRELVIGYLVAGFTAPR